MIRPDSDTHIPNLRRAPTMSKTLIPYATAEGQTAKIAEVIADVIRGHGPAVEAVDIETYRTLFPAATTE
jgi:hypothetical protein